MIAKWVKISFLYFLIAALLGAFLRYFFVGPVGGLNFQYLLHAHSHVAFLGWIFNALFAGLIFAYIPEKASTYRLLFWLLQVAVVGMLFTFPFQGYAAASITFSTLHIFLSWWFAVKFYRDTAAVKKANRFSHSLIRWSLIFMVLSAIGPFAIGAIAAQGLAGTPIYYLSIYFYLHFQYNGWFSFAILGLFFWLLENNNISFSIRYSKNLLVLMVISCVLGYALSALWTQPALWVYAVGMLAAVLQLIALAYLLLIVKAQKSALKNIFDKPTYNLLLLSMLAFVLKILMQFFGAFPAIADLSYAFRNLTIGYLHIIFLGFVSIFLISWFSQVGILEMGRRAWWGIWIFLTGFVLSELIIFLQPTLLLAGLGVVPSGNELLFMITVFMPAGIGISFFYSNFYGHSSNV